MSDFKEILDGIIKNKVSSNSNIVIDSKRELSTGNVGSPSSFIYSKYGVADFIDLHNTIIKIKSKY